MMRFIKAKDLWRRMAIEIPESVESGFLSSHPSSAERFLMIEKTATLINDGYDPVPAFGATVKLDQTTDWWKNVERYLR